MKLIRGGLLRRWIIDDIEISVVAQESLPAGVEVMVFEEDTNLILTIDKEMYFEDEHPIRLMTEILRAKKHEPGDLVCNGKSWYAVVVDLNSEKLCDARWVAAAYLQVFSESKKQGVSIMAIHLLGTMHARLAIREAVKVFVDNLKANRPPRLKQVWLIVTTDNIRAVRLELDQHT